MAVETRQAVGAWRAPGGGYWSAPGVGAGLSAVGVTGLLPTPPRSAALDGSACPHGGLRLESASNGSVRPGGIRPVTLTMRWSARQRSAGLVPDGNLDRIEVLAQSL